MAVEVLEFLIEHQDYFVLRLSHPTPTKIEALDLTSVSSVKPGLQADDLDVAEPSDSDEELGELTMHEGGGAKLARRSTTASAGEKKKSAGRFMKRKGAGATTEAGRLSVDAEDRTSLSTETSTPKPSTPKGDIVEMELGRSSSLTQSAGGLRRSRTAPSRRSNDEKREKRSESGGKAKVKRDVTSATSNTGSAIEEADADLLKQATLEVDTPTVAKELSTEATAADPGLPTPPSSKLLDVAAPETGSASQNV
jgi:hypothetical protein